MDYQKLTSLRSNLFVKILLAPVAFLYKIISYLRYYLYNKGVFQSKETRYPIISTGNIVMGGSGKTSLTVKLATELASHSRIKPAILSRGYKRKTDNVRVVKGRGDWEEYGDEPSLMKQKLKRIPIIVSKDRIRGLQTAREVSDSNCFLLDDGFQYLKLQKSFEILLLDAANPFGDYRFFPRGDLRDGLWRLEDADAIIISNTQRIESNLRELEKKIRGFAPEVPILGAHYEAKKVRTLEDEEMSLDRIIGKEAFLFAAIGNPDSLRSTVEEAGIDISDTHFFLDHHDYTDDDIHFLNTEFEKSSADIFVTTEKDGIKLKNFNFRGPVYQVVSDFVVDKSERLFNLIHTKLSEYELNKL